MKPDRFARMVDREMVKLVPYRKRGVVKLLRRQFAAIRRMVQQQACLYAGPDKCKGRDPSTCVVNRNNLLAALDAWKKGKP